MTLLTVGDLSKAINNVVNKQESTGAISTAINKKIKTIKEHLNSQKVITNFNLTR